MEQCPGTKAIFWLSCKFEPKARIPPPAFIPFRLLRSTLLRILIFVALLGTAFSAGAQSRLSGLIIDMDGKPLKGVKVFSPAENLRTRTNAAGRFSLSLPSNKQILLKTSYLGVEREEIIVDSLQPGTEREITLAISIDEVTTVTVRSDTKSPFMERVELERYTYIPNAGGGVENFIKMLAGVSSNNELSSQYSVRGGNYDENLVYINDIEIYRPQLVRSGQQEGLSIINSDMVKRLQFSAGGFENKYGDKLSSVLDITYREPDSMEAAAGLSALGASLSYGNAFFGKKLHVLAGARYRTNRYLLTSLDVQGDYRPAFGDFQAYVTYALTDNLKLGIFSYYGQNRYLSIPESQQTTFGTATTVLRLNVALGGRELLRFQNTMNAATLTWNIGEHTTLKWLNSIYTTDEEEYFDVVGVYSLNQLENDPGSTNFGGIKYQLGDGGYLNHGRNRLYATILNSEIRARHFTGKYLDLQYGFKVQRENIADKLSEYRYIDSADYSVPQQDSGRKTLDLYETIRSRNTQQWDRFSAFIQNTALLSDELKLSISAGARVNYWSYNGEWLLSPRAQLAMEPNGKYNERMINMGMPDSLLRRNLRIKAAIGLYQQPPFYRELRGITGTLNPEIRAQKSTQFLLGTDYYFKAWGRPFKLTAESYYKALHDLIPYEIDNVRLRYYATNNSRGYAAGLDLQLNGEIADGVPSWVSLSLMKTAEDLLDDSYIGKDASGQPITIYPGYIPRPTDQRVRVSAFIQDYLPNNETYKMHLQLVFGSGLPFGPPEHKRYLDVNRLPSYKRIDVGFSKMLYERGKSAKTTALTKNFRSAWLSLEIFNLFGINNTVAYLWVQDVNGNNFGVPRYLTGRRVNLHLELRF